MKKKIYKLINTNKFFVDFIHIIIILNVFSIILDSYENIVSDWGYLLHGFEIFSIVVFSIEYILRLFTADLQYKSKYRLISIGLFIVSTYGIIDLVAILPFYLPFFIPFDLTSIRLLRLFRLFRVFKMGRLSKPMNAVLSVLKESRSELYIALLVTSILLVLSSTLMYHIEHWAQPDKFTNFGQAMWWSVATLTTVGYGDIYPVTNIGKILAAIIALIGIGIVALPTGIISSTFIKKIQREKNKSDQKTSIICKCPKCNHLFEHKLD